MPAGGPLKPGFGLAGDVSNLPNPVIPTETDHRKAMVCEVEGPGVVTAWTAGCPILNFASFAKFRVGIWRVAHSSRFLKQGVSRRLIGETEHFWQKRYYDFNVRNESQFVEKLRCIHRNPVKRGLCARTEDWERSSFRQYATGCAGTVKIECEWAARKRERVAARLGPAAKPHSSQRTA
jgi:hypothetical protein